MSLTIYNSLTRDKEVFEPLVEGRVGMYVCGPTVYNDVHLGNCRTFVNFDVIYRYLLYLGYKVRYVRNITDVGHLEGDADSGAEDKMAKRARIEQLEPMEVAHKYTAGFHEMMKIFNTLSPSIEPRATGHIPEQIEMVQAIFDRGYAYENNGSVYFDTLKFAKENDIYGKLSGRILDDLIAESRDNLKNQEEKKSPADFAIWIKAAPEHLMRWQSPWSEGFPGWHLECSAMSTKYLGHVFDIHGGGNDLKFPHHENEIAQNQGACGVSPARIWMHANMLLLNGKKMSKSDGNTISPVELFSGHSPHVTKGYSPMAVRFFMLQSHYRSTLDMNDEALQAAEKGYRRLLESYKTLQTLQHPAAGNAGTLDTEINELMSAAFDDMNDDFNSPKAMSRLFELAAKINGLNDGHLSYNDLTVTTLQNLKEFYHRFIFDILGLCDETAAATDHHLMNGIMQLIIDLRAQSRSNKDWATSDKIRDTLTALNIQLKDSKEGTTWSVQ
ncbi:MAG: cysteine--tRNA ligase [Saprospiraceae bacterium]|nr:cysteine--tRNA ligase [Saprospiraceae bacterium]MBP7679447.1 cysteine--tRNA ligase [Saprospiraceae bacterium]